MTELKGKIGLAVSNGDQKTTQKRPQRKDSLGTKLLTAALLLSKFDPNSAKKCSVSSFVAATAHAQLVE